MSVADDVLDVVIGSRVHHVKTYAVLLNHYAKTLLLHIEALYFRAPQDSAAIDSAVECFKILVSFPRAAAEPARSSDHKLSQGDRILSAVHSQACLLLQRLIREETESACRGSLLDLLSDLITVAIGLVDQSKKVNYRVALLLVALSIKRAIVGQSRDAFCLFNSYNTESKEAPRPRISVATSLCLRPPCGHSVLEICYQICG
jgi:hypothetical protein